MTTMTEPSPAPDARGPRVLLKKLGKALLLAVLVGSIPVFMVGYAAYAALAWRHHAYLEAHGLRVDGAVLARDDSGTSRNPSFEVRYTYPEPGTGRRRERTEDVDEALHRRVAAGDRVTVWVDPEDPESALLAGNDHYIEPVTMAAMGLLLLGLAVVFVPRLYAPPQAVAAEVRSDSKSGDSSPNAKKPE